MSELERIERRLIQLEALVIRVLGAQECIERELRCIRKELEPPTTYPRSTGGTISVK